MRYVITALRRSARIALGLATASAGLVVSGGALGVPAQAAGGAETFASTGAEQTYVVPAGITSVHVVVVGAPGAGDPLTPGIGGLGRIVTADLPVTPGQTLYVEVGGLAEGTAGGFNGGGAGGIGARFSEDNIGHGGGGASDIRTCPAAGPCSSGASLDSRLAVAGGGGGGGVNDGGGADLPGITSFFPDSGGKAGTLVSGGAGGGPANQGATGSPGGYGVGGAAADGVGSGTPGGGGGGGGYYGGGGSGSGGAGGGGGGGSSYVTASATNVTYEYDADRTPVVTITPNTPPIIDPYTVDSDRDGLSDGAESTGSAACPGGSDPRRADTDGDGLSDGAEVAGWNLRQKVRTKQGRVTIGQVSTSPCAADTDGDGLSDARELEGVTIKQRVHRADGKVVRIGRVVTDPAHLDTDGDGLSDRSEMRGSKTKRFGRTKSSPVDYDTDRGGAADGREVAKGGDPTRYWSGPHKPRPASG